MLFQTGVMTRTTFLLMLGAACLQLCDGASLRPPIDKIIMDAASDSRMFDLMHMMPSGELMFMYDLDMMMTVEEYQEIFGNPAVSVGLRQKRKAIAYKDRRWTDCRVYYEFSPEIEEREREVIRDAIKEWENFTCLEFKPARSTNKDKILFRRGDGCFSRVGKVGNTQAIGLARGCVQKGVVIHEIGHAIGWFHEQARPDRDRYIRVNFNLIPEPWHSQFDKLTDNVISTYNVEYDYRSIMHYSGDAVATRSIETRDPRFQAVIGQREGLSFRDAMLANLMYKCAGMATGQTCASNCSAFGTDAFRDKNCKCMCPGSEDDGEPPVVECRGAPRPTTPPVTIPPPTGTPEPMKCQDNRPACATLKEQGHCSMYTGNMAMYCKKTCGFCDREACMDYEDSCPLLALGGFCKNSSVFYSIMKTKCRRSCKFCVPTDACRVQMALGLDMPDMPNKAAHWDVGACGVVFAVTGLLCLLLQRF